MKAAEIFAESGYPGLAKRAMGYYYRNVLRRFLPTISAVRYADIKISRDRKLGDLSLPQILVPFNVKDIPEYEATLIKGLRAHVRSGDTVAIVGGGEGVTVTIAAKAVGDTGSVTCFEGGKDYVKKVLGTAQRNGVSNRITIHHAIVGKSISVLGDEMLKSSKLVAPEDLQLCDVLELDCEGAEITILENMKILPRAIIVETHGIFGAKTTSVRDLLVEKGYEVSDLGWAEPWQIEYCEKHDIRILAAVKAPR